MAAGGADDVFAEEGEGLEVAAGGAVRGVGLIAGLDDTVAGESLLDGGDEVGRNGGVGVDDEDGVGGKALEGEIEAMGEGVAFAGKLGVVEPGDVGACLRGVFGGAVGAVVGDDEDVGGAAGGEALDAGADGALFVVAGDKDDEALDGGKGGRMLGTARGKGGGEGDQKELKKQGGGEQHQERAGGKYKTVL